MLHCTIELNLTSPTNTQYFSGTIINYNTFYKSNTKKNTHHYNSYEVNNEHNILTSNNSHVHNNAV